MAVYVATTAIDDFVGADAVADSFRFSATTLQAGDKAAGGGGAAIDVLQLTGSIGVDLAGYPLIGGIERVIMPTAAAAVTLSAAFGASAFERRVEVTGNSASDLVDASAFDGATRLVFTTGANSNDKVFGGAGADEIRINGAGALTAKLGGGADILRGAVAAFDGTHTLDGGAGLDTLVLVNAGSLAPGALTGLSSFETIQFHTFGVTRLAMGRGLIEQAGGRLTIVGNAADGVVDAGAAIADKLLPTLGGVTYLAGTGAETFFGSGYDDLVAASGVVSGAFGEGDDTLRLLAPGAPSTISGGEGFDRVELAVGGTFDLSLLSGYEEVALQAATTVKLGADAGLAVFGSDGADAVTLGGVGQTVYGLGGDDVVTASLGLLRGAVLLGGDEATRDTLVLTGVGSANLRAGNLVSGFERIEVVDASAPMAARTIVFGAQDAEIILRAGATVKLGTNAGQSLIGSRYIDDVTVGAAGQIVDTGAGADVVRVSAAQLDGGAQLSGGIGIDNLVITGGGAVDLLDTAVLGFERFTLTAATDLSTTGFGVDPVITGSAGDDVILLRGTGGVARGGLGDDTFRITAESAAGWAGDARTIDGGDDAAGRDRIEIESGIGPITVDFTRHKIEDIDRIAIRPAGVGTDAVKLTVGDGMVASAFSGLDGIFGRLTIDAVGGEVLQTVTVNAAGLTGANSIRFGDSGLFAGGDVVIGGAGGDLLIGGEGDDVLTGGGGDDTLLGGRFGPGFSLDGRNTLDGGAGDDALFGGNEVDVLITREGLDRVKGGAGGDIIILSDDNDRDVVEYTENVDGSFDINTSVAVTTADRVSGFEAGVDQILLSRPGLGLGAGAVAKLAGNAALNMAANSVFVFDDLDTLSSSEPIAGTLAELVGGMDDAGPVTGSTPGRTVVLMLSNKETALIRQTGMWLWTDSDGDGLVESTDTVKLLSVFDNLSTAEIKTTDFIL